jgi:hypothetical protein
MSPYDTTEYKVIEGAVVKTLDANEDRLILHLEDGRRATFELEGDCCSWSHFTDVRQFKELEGVRITKVEERTNEDKNKTDGENGEVSWHFLVFTTDKGHVTIDWRNDSNGYYDGSVIFSVEEVS